MKNHKGFSLIESLLILVIVALLGGTGWYVWNAKKNTNKSLNTAAQTEVTTTSTKPEIPEGYIKYENKDLGFSFAYPKEWGDAKFELVDYTKDDIDVSSGQSFSVRFDKQNVISIQGYTFDWGVPRGGSYGDKLARGYREKNEKFYEIVSDRAEVEPYSEELIIKNAKKVSGTNIVGIKTEYVKNDFEFNDCDPLLSAAFNIGQSQFPGISFNSCIKSDENKDTEKAIFDKVIQTFKKT